MKCFSHPNNDAIGTCKQCHRGLCIACAADTNVGLHCLSRCTKIVLIMPGLLGVLTVVSLAAAIDFGVTSTLGIGFSIASVAGLALMVWELSSVKPKAIGRVVEEHHDRLEETFSQLEQHASDENK